MAALNPAHPATAPLAVTVVGAGRIAQAHLQALAATPRAVLAAVVDPRPEATAPFAAARVPVFARLGDLLEGGTPPAAAIVCTPNTDHAATVSALLAAGCHVLVEKPLATTAAVAAELVAQAQARRLVLQTASKFGAMEALRVARGAITEGRIGAVVSVENIFSGPLAVAHDWRAMPDLSGGGVLMDNGPHALDVLAGLVGPPKRLRTVRAAHVQGTAVEDEIEVALEFAGGVTGRIVLSWNEAIPAPIALVRGTDGALTLGWQALVLRRGDTEERLSGGYDKNAAFAAVLTQFVDAVLAGGDQPGAAAPHGAATLAWLEAAYRSLANGGTWESLP